MRWSMSTNPREWMRLYMREYKRGLRRRPKPTGELPPTGDEVRAIKEDLATKHRLRAVGVKKR